MTEQEQIAQLEAENAKLRAKLFSREEREQIANVAYSAGVNYIPTISLLDMTRERPGFKAYCHRKSTAKLPTLAQRLEKARQAHKAKLKAALKSKGIWSILKSGPYWTGRLVGMARGIIPEELKLLKITRDEWTSEPPWEGETVPQNVPAFGQDAPLDEPSEPVDEGEDLTVTMALIEAIEAQNAILGQLTANRRAS